MVFKSPATSQAQGTTISVPSQELFFGAAVTRCERMRKNCVENSLRQNRSEIIEILSPEGVS
jgi:hypothetical protein